MLLEEHVGKRRPVSFCSRRMLETSLWYWIGPSAVLSPHINLHSKRTFSQPPGDWLSPSFLNLVNFLHQFLVEA